MLTTKLSLAQADDMLIGLHEQQIISQSGLTWWQEALAERYREDRSVDRQAMLHGLSGAFAAAEMYRQGIIGPGSPDGKAYAKRQASIENNETLSQVEKDRQVQQLREQQLTERRQAEGYLLEAALVPEAARPAPKAGWVLYPPHA